MIWFLFRMIYLYPKGEEGVEDFLSIYLTVVKTTNMSEGWSRDVKFKLFVFNHLNANITFTEGSCLENFLLFIEVLLLFLSSHN